MSMKSSRRSVIASLPAVAFAGCVHSDSNEDGLKQIEELTVSNRRDDRVSVTLTVDIEDEETFENQYTLGHRQDREYERGVTIEESFDVDGKEFVIFAKTDDGLEESTSNEWYDQFDLKSTIIAVRIEDENIQIMTSV